MGGEPRTADQTVTVYSVQFYELEAQVAHESAEVVLPVVLEKTGAKSVIDVGCGTGAWAAVALNLGCTIEAVDFGVPEHLKLVNIVEHDLNHVAYPCKGWDLAICLETAEHLDPEAGPYLIRGLSEARSVLFSAATPGQPGVGHINTRPHAYWHALFARYGFIPTHIGPDFGPPVASFYVRNLFLYQRTGE